MCGWLSKLLTMSGTVSLTCRQINMCKTSIQNTYTPEQHINMHVTKISSRFLHDKMQAILQSLSSQFYMVLHILLTPPMNLVDIYQEEKISQKASSIIPILCHKIHYQ